VERIRRPWSRYLPDVVLLALAAGAALAPTQPSLIERWFSAGIYPRIQHLVTPVSNLVPFALLDLLVGVAVVAIVWALARAIRSAWRLRRIAPLASTLLHVASAVAAVYLVFLGVWGLNYRRLSMADRLVIDPAAPTNDDVVSLGMEAVARLNALHDQARARDSRGAEWQDPDQRAAFDQVQSLLSDAPAAVPGRLKRTIFGPYFRWTSVDGMVNPIGLEVLANPDLLPFERPFVAAHEWAHLAGYADESEANFVGWLTCLHASPAAQYSGWMFLYWETSGVVGSNDRARLAAALAPGPRSDLAAVADRIRRGQLTLLRNASWMMYDQYLKANRVDEGIRSYGEVVPLILRAKFDAGWTPVRRRP
jgi:hypothetical protein